MSINTEIAQDKAKNAHKAKVYTERSTPSADVYRGADWLRNQDGKKVDFNNLQEVKERTYRYLDACAAEEVFPSLMGLASFGYGVTRQAVYAYMRRNPNSSTTEFIARVQDVIADILTNASLNNRANVVQVIFQLKNHYGHSDKVDIQPVGTHEADTFIDAEEIRKRYM